MGPSCTLWEALQPSKGSLSPQVWKECIYGSGYKPYRASWMGEGLSVAFWKNELTLSPGRQCVCGGGCTQSSSKGKAPTGSPVGMCPCQSHSWPAVFSFLPRGQNSLSFPWGLSPAAVRAVIHRTYVTPGCRLLIGYEFWGYLYGISEKKIKENFMVVERKKLNMGTHLFLSLMDYLIWERNILFQNHVVLQ